jgi:hypothetical protein
MPGRDAAEGAREAVEAEMKRDDPQACERKVDEAVEMTFPASDPTATGRATGTEPAARPASRQASIPSKEDIERAAAGRG